MREVYTCEISCQSQRSNKKWRWSTRIFTVLAIISLSLLSFSDRHDLSTGGSSTNSNKNFTMQAMLSSAVSSSSTRAEESTTSEKHCRDSSTETDDF